MNKTIENLKKQLARKEEIIDNFLEWVGEHDKEFVQCAIDAMDLTPEEIEEYYLQEYVEDSAEDDED